MFTGLVECCGALRERFATGGDFRLHFSAPEAYCADIRLGDSVAISGVCLTVVAPHSEGFAADVSNETLRLTSLGALAVGARVNLEKALLPSTRMGGHFVSGHVDGLARICFIQPDARSQRWLFEVDSALGRYIAVKGSVCLDGVSLTVNTVHDLGAESGRDLNQLKTRFEVNLIPHTLENTNLSQRHAGEFVNIEVDLLARYLDRLRTA
jgi:riboflavin synthase